MCGIAGYVQRADAKPSPIDRMTDRLTHRGPDGRGVWRGSREGSDADGHEWSIALGHRRLSIIDLEGGKQPLSNEDGSVWITFNGEIYNFHELRRTLELAGHRFATHSDTEAIVHGFEQEGAASLAALDGMFAFAIWDSRAGRLTLARDRVGIKPLYYAPLPGGGLAFASELTALLEHPDVDGRLSPEGLASYFFSDYAHAPLTVVRGARKLEPGHCLVWSVDGKIEYPARPFWSMSASRAMRGAASGAVETVRAEVRSAVAAQMVSDVPVGVFLSGGIDSSIVAALAQQHSLAGGGAGLQSFSIAFEDPSFDESAYARMVAKQIGTRHVEKTFGENDILTTLDAALDCLDEPMADSSILPTYLLSKMTAEHVKVVLSGDGGDELWAGYPTYKAHRYAAGYAAIPRAVRHRVIDPIVRRMPVRAGYQTLEWKAKRFALRWDDEPIRRHFRWMSSTDLPDLQRCLHARGAEPGQLARASAGLNGDLLNNILALDFASYLPGSVLCKVDRAAMAHGLEVRPPMLHNGLIELAFSLPSSIKLRGTTTKAVLKDAAAGWIPDQVIHRRKKGFAIPLARWMNGALAGRLNDVLGASPVWETGLLYRETFVEWRNEHREKKVDRARPLWALIVLDHWLRRL